MHPRTLANVYLWALKGLLFIIPFLSLWIASSFYFPYITGRNFAFRIIIEAALALWIGLIVLDKRYLPRSGPILWAIFAFVAVVGIADLLGVDPYRSFWSNYERMEGYLMILHLAAYFLVATSVFRTKREWLQFFHAFLFAGVLVGGYGILQVLDLKQAIQGGDVRIDGTIGNPTYLAAYLLLVAGAAFLLFFNASKKGLRYFYGASIVYFLGIMYFAASRGVTLAILASVPIALAGYLLLTRRSQDEMRGRRVAAGALGILVALPIVFLLVKNTSFVQNNEVLSRFASISLGERTTRSRFMIWNMSWQGVKERPLLGWGQENYIKVFSKYYNPRLYDQEPWFDRAHNIVFDWLINAGFFGLVAYIAIFVALYRTLWKLFRKGAMGIKEGSVLFVLPIAYFLQNIFVFDNFNTYVFFFSFLAYAYGLDRPEEDLKKSNVSSKLTEERALLSIVFVALTVVVAGLSIYYANIKPAAQARAIIKSLLATSDNIDPYGKTMASFNEAFAYDTFGNGETLEQFLKISELLLTEAGVPNETKKEFVESAGSRAEEYLASFPEAIRIHLMAGSMYQNASFVDGAYLVKARDHLKAALELSPKKQSLFFVLAENYLRNQEIAKAFELIDQAIALEPTNPEARVLKASMAVLVDRDDIVLEVIRALDKERIAGGGDTLDQALAVFINALDRIAQLYLRVGAKDKARVIYQEITRVAPNPLPYQEIVNDLAN